MDQPGRGTAHGREVEKQFKKSSALDTDQEFTITAGAPGTYTYFCSVHPKMTGAIVVEKS